MVVLYPFKMDPILQLSFGFFTFVIFFNPKEVLMPVRPIHQTPSAYSYPLLIKNILKTPLIYNPDREIVYRDKMTYTYSDLDRRVSNWPNP
jgi:hypothetical protein